MDQFFLKQNDTSPAIRRTLASSAGPIDLTGASVVFNMRVRSTRAVIISRQPCEIESATGGVVVYQWVAGDTAQVGTFDAEFEITYAGGAVETVPNNSYVEVKIMDDIA